MRSIPRAPIDAYGLTASTPRGAMPFCERRWLSAAPRSAAESASVPSKSNRTARRTAAACPLPFTNASKEVVDVAVRAEPVLPRERVVVHAEHLVGAQAARAAPA